MWPRETELADGARLSIAPVEEADAEAMAAYVPAVGAESDFLTFGPGEWEPTVEEERDMVARLEERGVSLMLKGEVDGELIGLASAERSSRPRLVHQAQIGMSVRRSWWGRGAGRAMMDAVIDWARLERVRHLRLMVRTDNDRALRLYRGLGFEVEGTLPRYFLLEGRFFPVHVMGLPID